MHPTSGCNDTASLVIHSIGAAPIPLYDFPMIERIGEQDTGGSDTVEEMRKHRRILVGKMEMNWRKFKQERGQDGRDWEKLDKEELEKMHTEIAGWIQECQDEMRVRPL